MLTLNTVLQDRYSVAGKIGQGGMGAVYLATDLRFGSTVAIKESFYTDANLRKAFEREASLLNRLRHPALPKVSDHFTDDNGQFLVMEYIAGEDLSELLEKRGGAFPVSQVLDWADQLLDALDFLHTQELPIIHRDIKPQNLKLTARNRIVLLDFGLAKGAAIHFACATVTGSVFGYSRNYAPLEQMQGAGTDPRSDIYSLGATLYHLLTNTIPPDALTRAAAVINGQSDPLRPANEVHAQVPKVVARVLAQAMRQDAGGRCQTAAEMRSALRLAQEHLDSDEANADDPRLFAPLFFEQETRRFDSLMGSHSPEATNNLHVQQTTPMGVVGRDMSPDSGVSAPQREAYVTKLMMPAPVMDKQPASRKPIIVAVAASVVALLVTAATAMNFIGIVPPTVWENRHEAEVSVAQGDSALAPVAQAENTPMTETDAQNLVSDSTPGVNVQRARTDVTSANRPATRRAAPPTVKNQKQRKVEPAEAESQGFVFPAGEFDYRRMQIDISALDKAIAGAPNEAERTKIKDLKKKWMLANKWRIQQKQNDRIIVAPPRPPEALEHPARPQRDGDSRSSPPPFFQSAEPMIRARSSDSRRAQTRASSPGSWLTKCSG